MWVKRNLPEVFAQIDSFGMISDWIVTKLTGEFVTEPTNASTSGFFDIAKRNWSKEMLELVELSEDVIPRVQEPGTIAGQLKPEIRQRFGFAPDTVVVMGGETLSSVPLALAQCRRGTLLSWAEPSGSRKSMWIM